MNTQNEALAISISQKVETRTGKNRARLIFAVLIATIFTFFAYLSHQEYLFEKDSDTAYYVGIVGGVMFLVLFMFPLRKHFKMFRTLGPVRFWFRLHMFLGIAAPLVVLFHSTFRVGATNSKVALFSMLIAMASGVFGRFIYMRIHQGLYGQKLTMRELKKELENEQKQIDLIAGLHKDIRRNIDQFLAIANSEKMGTFAKIKLGARARRAKKECFRAIDSIGETSSDQLETTKELLTRYFNVAVKASQFTFYERLFRQWHVLHVPFIVFLILSSIVHIIAVHMY